MLQIPAQERPRERLARYGSEALSSIELLAILLSSGYPKRNVLEVASDLLIRFKSLEQIGDAELEELAQINGIGLAKALQLKAAFALAARLQKGEQEKIPYEPVEKLVAVLSLEFSKRKSEVVMVLLCNIKKQIFHREIIAIGTLTEVMLHPREVFCPAIRKSAHSIILTHNHPSGDPSPSLQDLKMTQAIRIAGSTLGIALLDHLIIARQNYFSFREKGLLI